MAFTDWTFLSNLSENVAEPYAFGLSSPEPTAGSFARAIRSNTAGSLTGVYGGFRPSDPAFTGVSSANAIRVQSFIYNAAVTGDPRRQLIVKQNPASTFATDAANGYVFGIEGNASIRFRAPGSLNILLATGVVGWYSLRMTVYPITPSVDQIVCEQESSPGSGVWSSTFPGGSGIINIDNNLTPDRYIAWGGNRINGVFAATSTSFGISWVAFFDKTRVSLSSPVPAPVP
jgi:hypothetical protein